MRMLATEFMKQSIEHFLCLIQSEKSPGLGNNSWERNNKLSFHLLIQVDTCVYILIYKFWIKIFNLINKLSILKFGVSIRSRL